MDDFSCYKVKLALLCLSFGIVFHVAVSISADSRCAVAISMSADFNDVLREGYVKMKSKHVNVSYCTNFVSESRFCGIYIICYACN